MLRDLLRNWAGVTAGAALLVFFDAARTAQADEGQAMAYGKHLSQQCTTCHRLDGTSSGIPAIVGWDRAAFVAVMKSYKDKVRTNEVMVSLAQSLGDPEIEALAVYFGSLKPPPAKAAPKKR